MNKMKFSNRNFSSILLIAIFIFSFAGTFPVKYGDYDFGNLKNKSYYITLFNDTEKAELEKADEDYKNAKIKLLSANKYFEKAEGYQKISKKFAGKSANKVKRYNKKGVKNAIKAYKLFFKASDRKFHVYSENLKKIKNNNSKKHLKAEGIGINARSTYMEGIDLKNEANSLKGIAKINKLDEAFKTHILAIKRQETAFGIFMNDPEFKNYLEDENSNVVTNTNKTNNLNDKDTYKPIKDPNIYVSREEEILSKINISNSDKSKLEDANDKKSYAETIMKETDAEYEKIARIRKKAVNTNSETDRNLQNKMASAMEKSLFDKMIKAANMMFDANNTKYEVYDKYLPEARNSKNFKEGRKYEANALSLHSYAKKTYNKANFYSGHKSNKYIKLMDAVQTEMSAIQEQENAFSTYFKMKVTPLDEVVAEVENKNGPKKGNNKGKTNDNSGKTKTNNKKLTYNYSGSYFYSIENPTPKKIVHKKGIIFKVQIGLFKDLISLKQYGKYSPISFDTYKNNPYKRFMLGEYRSYKAAEYVLNKVAVNGLDDPFIVAYENGNRKTSTYGISKLIRDDNFEKTEAEEMAYLTGEKTKQINVNVTDNKDNNEINKDNMIIPKHIGINNIKYVKGLVYCVQLGNFSKKKSLSDFKGAEPVFFEDNLTTYKYVSGTFPSYKLAKQKANELKNKGYEGTFVVAYNEGAKISLDKAKSLSENNTTTPINKVNIYFTVQVGAYSHKLSNEEMSSFDKITPKYKLTVNKVDGGLFLYTIGKFNTYEKATIVKKDIKNMGVDGFVIAFKNGNRISAKDAKDFLKKNK